MVEKTIVIGFRLKEDTIKKLDDLREKEFGNFLKRNAYIQVILDRHITNEETKAKRKPKK